VCRKSCKRVVPHSSLISGLRIFSLVIRLLEKRNSFSDVSRELDCLAGFHVCPAKSPLSGRLELAPATNTN
jgi:hypothetical protein